MLLSYNADLLPRVRMLGRINYTEPWIHFSRTINEYVLYVIRDGNMYLREDGALYHLKAGDFFLLEPGLHHEGYQRASCNYYYAHFTHPEMARAEDESTAMAQLAEKRRLSLVSYNLDDADPTDPITYLPKQFHLPRSESHAALRAALDCYNAREEHYKRRVLSGCGARASARLRLRAGKKGEKVGDRSRASAPLSQRELRASALEPRDRGRF